METDVVYKNISEDRKEREGREDWEGGRAYKEFFPTQQFATSSEEEDDDYIETVPTSSSSLVLVDESWRREEDLHSWESSGSGFSLQCDDFCPGKDDDPRRRTPEPEDTHIALSVVPQAFHSSTLSSEMSPLFSFLETEGDTINLTSAASKDSISTSASQSVELQEDHILPVSRSLSLEVNEDSPCLRHPTAARAKPPTRRPPSGKFKKSTFSKTSSQDYSGCSDEEIYLYANDSSNNSANNSPNNFSSIPLNTPIIVSSSNTDNQNQLPQTVIRDTISLEDKDIDVLENNSLDEDSDAQVLIQEMLDDGDTTRSRRSGEGVRQKFYRTKIIPKLEEGVMSDEEDILLGEYATTHSYLDSILSTIEPNTVSDLVEFPELGRDLVESRNVKNFDPVSMMSLGSTTWGENWVVEGVQHFQEEQQQHVVETDRKRERIIQRIIPEVVPFLVPNTDQDPVAIIGEMEADQVSELSEHSSVGSIQFSTSSDSDIDTGHSETIQEFLGEEECQPGLGEGTHMETWSQKGEERLVVVEMEEEPLVIHDPILMGSEVRLELVSSPPEMVSVCEVGMLHLQCKVQGVKPIDICWFYSGDPITESEYVHMFQSSPGHHHLLLYEVSQSQAGHYSLAVVNSGGEVWHTFTVEVSERERECVPPSITTFCEDLDVQEGDTLTMEMAVQGFPEPRLLIYREGRMVRSTEQYCLEYCGSGHWKFVLMRSSMKDSGLYSVTATSSLGSVTKEWNLTVNPVDIQTKSSYEDSNLEVLEDHSVVSGDISDPDFYKLMASRLELQRKSCDSIHGNENVKEDVENIVENKDKKIEKLPEKPAAAVKVLLGEVPGESKTEEEDEEALSLFDPKWETQTVTISNNPYTKEGIKQRKISRSILPMPQVNISDVNEWNLKSSKKLNVGPKDIDKYLNFNDIKRNFVVKPKQEETEEFDELMFNWTEKDSTAFQESTTSEETSSSEHEYEEAVQVADSGVDSEQTSLDTNSVEDVLVESAQNEDLTDITKTTDFLESGILTQERDYEIPAIPQERDDEILLINQERDYEILTSTQERDEEILPITKVKTLRDIFEEKSRQTDGEITSKSWRPECNYLDWNRGNLLFKPKTMMTPADNTVEDDTIDDVSSIEEIEEEQWYDDTEDTLGNEELSSNREYEGINSDIEILGENDFREDTNLESELEDVKLGRLEVRSLRGIFEQMSSENHGDAPGRLSFNRNFQSTTHGDSHWKTLVDGGSNMITEDDFRNITVEEANIEYRPETRRSYNNMEEVESSNKDSEEENVQQVNSPSSVRSSLISSEDKIKESPVKSERLSSKHDTSSNNSLTTSTESKEPSPKASVKMLREHFVNNSSPIRSARSSTDTDLAHIPEDLRQFFQTSPRNDFIEEKDRVEITGMVTHFKKETRINREKEDVHGSRLQKKSVTFIDKDSVIEPYEYSDQEEEDIEGSEVMTDTEDGSTAYPDSHIGLEIQPEDEFLRNARGRKLDMRRMEIFQREGQ